MVMNNKLDFQLKLKYFENKSHDTFTNHQKSCEESNATDVRFLITQNNVNIKEHTDNSTSNTYAPKQNGFSLRDALIEMRSEFVKYENGNGLTDLKKETGPTTQPKSNKENEASYLKKSTKSKIEKETNSISKTNGLSIKRTIKCAISDIHNVQINDQKETQPTTQLKKNKENEASYTATPKKSKIEEESNSISKKGGLSIKRTIKCARNNIENVQKNHQYGSQDNKVSQINCDNLNENNLIELSKVPYKMQKFNIILKGSLYYNPFYSLLNFSEYFPDYENEYYCDYGHEDEGEYYWDLFEYEDSDF